MTTDTTHITKEGLLQAMEEICGGMKECCGRGVQNHPEEPPECCGQPDIVSELILARAAELSAQENKPVDERNAVLERMLAEVFAIGVDKADWHQRARAVLSTAPSVSAQDASPKDAKPSSANDRAMAHYDE